MGIEKCAGEMQGEMNGAFFRGPFSFSGDDLLVDLIPMPVVDLHTFA